ncbi:MAG TPA: MarR family winged helix-turn-helix transcriptional regulator [Amycolatopsis sp.]|jgi:DNA-binding MarR family transcriptional regulator|nr:MarR family winged helix-turn-helix transcriptional regulator [Amycolatopsis sp.]
MSCPPSHPPIAAANWKPENQGLVQRRPHLSDRRAKEIVLTAAGHKSRAGVLDRLNRASPLISLSQDQQESLAGLLRVLLEPQGRQRPSG